MASPKYMELGFNFIYSTFIFCIILVMTLRMKRVKPEHMAMPLKGYFLKKSDKSVMLCDGAVKRVLRVRRNNYEHQARI